MWICLNNGETQCVKNDRFPARMWDTMKAVSSAKKCAVIRIRLFYLMRLEKAHPDVFNILLQVLMMVISGATGSKSRF